MKRRRAEKSGISLTKKDARIVKGMLKRGDRQHDIASWFGVNSGRIAEIATGDKHASERAAPNGALPPPGPYLSGRAGHFAVVALLSAMENLKAAVLKIEEMRR